MKLECLSLVKATGWMLLDCITTLDAAAMCLVVLRYSADIISVYQYNADIIRR